MNRNNVLVWFGSFFLTLQVQGVLFGFILAVPGNVTGQQLESTFTFLSHHFCNGTGEVCPIYFGRPPNTAVFSKSTCVTSILFN